MSIMLWLVILPGYNKELLFNVVASQSRGAFINSLSMRPSALVKQYCEILARIRVNDMGSLVKLITKRFV